MKRTGKGSVSILEKLGNHATELSDRLLLNIQVVCARRGMHALAAQIFRLQIRRWGTAGDDAQCRCLILPKGGFNQDVNASFGRDPRFAVYAIDRRILKAIADQFLPKEIHDDNYRVDTPEVTAAKQRYRDFLTRAWTLLSRVRQFDIVLSGNYCYYAEREFAAALESLDIPFVVLHKEGLNTVGLQRFWRKINRERRGPWEGRKILVYNEEERNLQIDSDVVTPDKVVVTGMPRLDRVIHWRESIESTQEGNPDGHVLFLAFHPTTGLPSIPDIPGLSEPILREFEALHWHELTRSCYAAMIDLAETLPDTEIVVKAKADVPSLKALEDNYPAGTLLPGNLTVVRGGDVFPYIPKSKAIIGLKSTALLESIGTNKPVIVPRFGEVAQLKADDYMLDLGDTVIYAGSQANLIELATEAVRGNLPAATPETRSLRDRVLERWLGNSDGLSGARVASELLEVARTRSHV